MSEEDRNDAGGSGPGADEPDEHIRAIARGASPRLWRTLAVVQFLVILVVGVGIVVMAETGWGPFAPGPAPGTAAQAAETWVCPMHPQIRQDHPGECPICAMTLVKQEAAPAAPAAGAWVCPMHPQIRQDHPGECPICAMALVEQQPQKPSGSGGGHGGHAVPGLVPVSVPLAFVQAGGVRTAKVDIATLADEVVTVGRVEADETRLARVHSRVMGWVTHLAVNQMGQYVNKGDPLLEVFSREVLQTQQELIALTRRGGRSAVAAVGDPIGSLADAARQRLAVFDVPPDVIDEIVRSGRATQTVPVRSPVSGYVIEKMVVEGTYLEPAMEVFEIADLSNVWVWADLYESDIPKVFLGNRAEVTTLATGDRVFPGEVTFFDPMVGEMTRTLRVRIEIANPDMALRPGMWASVRIVGSSADVPSVPYDAVVDTGTSAYVFVQTAADEFTPRAVTVGRSSGGLVEVKSGLDLGEIVLSSGTFLVDSESRVLGGGAAGGGGAHAGHGEGGGEDAGTGTGTTGAGGAGDASMDGMRM